MDDAKIIALYFDRNEIAINVTAEKYGRYCYRVANNILADRSDSEECVNDTYMNAWNSMPPKRPTKLAAFLGKITRNLAIDRYKRLNSEKRGRGQIPLVLDEMKYCLEYDTSLEALTDSMVIAEVLNRYLSEKDVEKRRMFLQRYYYFSSIKDIAHDSGCSESKVKMTLMRMREELRALMIKEGFTYEVR